MSKFTERARKRLEENIQRKEVEKEEMARGLEWEKKRESENMEQCKAALRSLQAESFLREVSRELLDGSGRITQKDKVVSVETWDEVTGVETSFDAKSTLVLSWHGPGCTKSIIFEASKDTWEELNISPRIEISGVLEKSNVGREYFSVGIKYKPNNLEESFQQVRSDEMAEKVVEFILAKTPKY